MIPKIKMILPVVLDVEDGVAKDLYDTVEVEVLTVHFKENTMRVRYTLQDYYGEGPRVTTTNCSADEFFKQCSVRGGVKIR